MNSYKSWTDEQLVEAVKVSYSYTDTIRALGFTNVGNIKTVQKHIVRLNLDISHFRQKGSTPHKKSLEEVLQFGTRVKTVDLKNRLIAAGLLKNECSSCGLLEWSAQWITKNLSLHLDHIDGNPVNNQLQNLRLLCPNCHSLTETFCRGYKRLVPKPKQFASCEDCAMQINRYSKRCGDCERKRRQGLRTKIKWPSVDELMKLVESQGYSETGRLLGVSDNAVRTHLKKYGRLE